MAIAKPATTISFVELKKGNVCSPRSSGPQTSAMVPPARVRGAEPKNPQRNREARRHPILGARAHGMLKMM